MNNPYTDAALAEDRHKTLLAQADALRLRRQARSGERLGSGRPRRWIARIRDWLDSELNRGTLAPLANADSTVGVREPSLAAWIESVSDRTFLPAADHAAPRRNASAVLIRPIEVGDGALLTNGYARLSDRSRQLRFLSPKPSLSPAELHDLIHVDHRDKEALVALSKPDGQGIGIARYVRDANDPQSAEVAAAVIDEWQGRGIGAELIARLIERAEDEGIRRCTALIADENTASVRLLHSLGPDVAVLDRDHHETEYQITFARQMFEHLKRTRHPCS